MHAPRRWKGKDGMFEADAIFISVFQRTKVKLQKVSGGVIAVPLERLSKPDVDYLISHFGLDEWNRLTMLKPVETKSTPSITTFSQTISPLYSISPSATKSLSIRQYQPNFAPQSKGKRQQQQQQQHRSLFQLPTFIIIKIGFYLDVRSRLDLSRTSKKGHATIMNRDIWTWIDFTSYSNITDLILQKLTHLLLRFQLHYGPQHVILDHTRITANSICHLLQYFPSIRTLSFRHCPTMNHHDLANQLDALVSPCRPDLQVFKMISKWIEGQDIKRIHISLERLAQHPVILDCAICDKCQVNACTLTMTCLYCGILPLKQCKACAPTCDRCQIRLCDQHTLSLTRLDCGRCHLPLAVCEGCRGQGCTTHGWVHTRCRIKSKWSSNACTNCGAIVCPFCNLMKCGGGCRGQWCSQCVNHVHLHPCKCILIHGIVGSKMTKRMVCDGCKKVCENCVSGTFCHRCLDLHQQECP